MWGSSFPVSPSASLGRSPGAEPCHAAEAQELLGSSPGKKGQRKKPGKKQVLLVVLNDIVFFLIYAMGFA